MGPRRQPPVIFAKILGAGDGAELRFPIALDPRRIVRVTRKGLGFFCCGKRNQKTESAEQNFQGEATHVKISSWCLQWDTSQFSGKMFYHQDAKPQTKIPFRSEAGCPRHGSREARATPW